MRYYGREIPSSSQKRRLVAACSGRPCSWPHKWRHPLPAPRSLRRVTERGFCMVHWRTGLGLSLSLLGTMVLGTSCFAQTQEQQASAAPEKGTDERGGAKREAEKAGISVQPASDWLDRDNRVGLPLLKNIAEDQKALWIAPTRLRFGDPDLLSPLAGTSPTIFPPH